MNKVEIVKTAFTTQDPDKAAAFFADNFQFTDEVGSPPMNKEQWFGMGEMLRTSFPDFEFVVESAREDNGKIKVVGHFAGTFANDLDASSMGMGVIKASGKKVRWPSGSSHVTVKDGLITKGHSMDTGPDAGMAGFFKTLGVGQRA